MLCLICAKPGWNAKRPLLNYNALAALPTTWLRAAMCTDLEIWIPRRCSGMKEEPEPSEPYCRNRHQNQTLSDIRKILVSVTFFVRDSGAGNGCPNFMDTWKNEFSLQEKPMPIKFRLLDGQNRQSPIASDFGSRTPIAALFAVLLYQNV